MSSEKKRPGDAGCDRVRKFLGFQTDTAWAAPFHEEFGGGASTINGWRVRGRIPEEPWIACFAKYAKVKKAKIRAIFDDEENGGEPLATRDSSGDDALGFRFYGPQIDLTRGAWRDMSAEEKYFFAAGLMNGTKEVDRVAVNPSARVKQLVIPLVLAGDKIRVSVVGRDLVDIGEPPRRGADACPSTRSTISVCMAARVPFSPLAATVCTDAHGLKGPIVDDRKMTPILRLGQFPR